MKTRMTAAEGTKMLKQTLQKAFPGTKFSTRMSRGTGYGYVSVYYTDGPAFNDVNAIASGFEGSGFDGMIDLEYTIDTCYCPVHGAQFAGTPGTHGSRGTVPASGVDGIGEHNILCCEKAFMVDFGLRGVSVTRDVSVDSTLAAVECFNHGNYNGTVQANVKEGHCGTRYVEVMDTTEGAQTPWLTPHFAEYLRGADLRDLVALARRAEQHKAEREVEYLKWRTEYNERENSKTIELGHMELNGKQRLAQYQRPAYGSGYLNN